MDLTIIFPAYNEESGIKKTLKSYLSYFPDKEFIVEMNGCTDNTPEIVANLASQHSNLECVLNEERLGKGLGIKKAFLKSKTEYVGFVDSDGSIPPNEFQKLITELEDCEMDCVVGSRYLPESVIGGVFPLKRAILSKLFIVLVKFLFNLELSDFQCGAKLFRRGILEKAFEKTITKGFAFDVEILQRIKDSGGEISEVPIVWKHSPLSDLSLHRVVPEMALSITDFFVSYHLNIEKEI